MLNTHKITISTTDGIELFCSLQAQALNKSTKEDYCSWLVTTNKAKSLYGNQNFINGEAL